VKTLKFSTNIGALVIVYILCPFIFVYVRSTSFCP